MITGKNSIWKMLALFALVLVAVLDIIFAQNRVVAYINCGVSVVVLSSVVYDLWMRWRDK